MHVVTPRRVVPAPSGGGIADPLAPIRDSLRVLGRSRPLVGIAPRLTVDDEPGWVSASALADGSRVADLVEASRRRFDAAPPAAVALAWKSYSYWLALPAVLGWASARRVPLLYPDDVCVGLGRGEAVPRVGLRRGARVAVLPHDPLAVTGGAAVVVVEDESALLAALHRSLRLRHVDPVIAQLRRHVRISARTLLGSLASGVAHGLLGAADVLPGATLPAIDVLLETLEVADLAEVGRAADGTWVVQRRTCCLAFTLPTPKVCGGCCLRPQLG